MASFFLICGVASGCSGNVQEHTEHGSIFSGTVTTDAGATLLDFCADFGSPQAEVIKFPASAGSRIKVEEVLDRREYTWEGPGAGRNDPPSFWCSGGGHSTSMSGMWVRCLTVTGSDPPATLDKVEGRGVPGIGGGVTGFALFLTVKHPGVLDMTLDGRCVSSIYHAQHDSTAPIGQLTILPLR